MNLKIASYNISGGFFNSSDTTEYLEGLGHIMDAMVQTFAIK